MDESSTGTYTSTLQDEDGNAIVLTDVDSMTMTLIEESGGSTINSRSAQDILNTNDVTFHATSGLLTWDIQVEDTALQLSTTAVESKERHLAVITIVWSTTKRMHREILLRCLNLNNVPQS